MSAAIFLLLAIGAPAANASDSANANDHASTSDSANVPDADAPTVGASLDKSEAHVGDRLTLTISAVAKTGIAVSLPAKLELGKLEVLDRSEGDRAGRDLGDGRRSHRFVLGVAAYEIGELEIPAIPISYLNARGEVRTVDTEPLALRIRGLVADDEPKPEVQPPRPPRSALVEDKRVMRVVRWGAIALGGLVVLVFAGLLLRRALRRSDEALAGAPLAPSRPPDEIAMEKLRALRAAGNFSADGYRPFYFAVAEVVRAYLGARYGFDSLELTTTELLNQLIARAPHLSAPDGEVARFLADTDLVKFAKTGSTDAAANGALDAAQAIVLSTAKPLETVAQAISGPVRLPLEGDGG
ncbi:MAG TPA: BatD family protein [Polyangia bacterium]|nr:BatD family protein [Polyangia bacterium]